MSKKRSLCLIIMGYALIAVIICVVVAGNGIYPTGSDTMCHIYKGDALYHCIQEGNLYPLYDPMWYNGVEMMRYWAPLPVYVLAGCEWLAGGDALTGFVLYNGLIFFFGALSMLYIGEKLGRRWLGAFFGVLWFFMPNNLLALYYEGNLPRSLSMVFLPLFICFAETYLRERERKNLIWIFVTFTLIALCHTGYAGMVALTLIVYLFLYCLLNRTWVQGLNVLLATVAGFLVFGIWLVPSLIGGIGNTDSSEVMATFFQSAWLSLNPISRIQVGNVNFYYGLAAFLIAVFGVIAAKKSSIPGFLTAVLVFFGTTLSAFPILSSLPGSQYLWMLRFISIALCLILYSMLLWKTCRTWILVLCCVLLFADTLPSLPLMVGNQSWEPPEDRLDQKMDIYLIGDGQEQTKQRLALMDLSGIGATGAYLVSGYRNPVAATFGAGWQSAATATNIVQFNRAFSGGYFRYFFDRAIELGNDTVILKMDEVDWFQHTEEELQEAADLRGYKLVSENGNYRVYHVDLPEQFGVISRFDAIGIGTGAGMISLDFPTVEETESANLNDYTYEELSQYQTVYLNGFTYDDKEEAENLVRRLSNNGVRVVLLADGIPENKSMKENEFLGVRCNQVTFSNGYPELDVRGEIINTDLFRNGFSKWNTVYLTGLDQVYGFTTEDNVELPFYGTKENDNIIFLGINLTYHYALTLDHSVEGVISEIFNMEMGKMPQREIVPLTVAYGTDTITITSPKDDVNTTIAMHDNFTSEQEIYSKNHLTYVKAGTTVIQMHYPYLWRGILVSVCGLSIMIVLYVMAGKGESKRKKNA